MPWGRVEHVGRSVRCTGVHWGYRKVGMKSLGGGSAGFLPSYPFLFSIVQSRSRFPFAIR